LEKLFKLSEQGNDTEILNIAEENSIFERICEDVALCKCLRVVVREVRKTLKQIGIMSLKEYSMNDHGEHFKIQRSHVKVIHEKLNMSQITSMVRLMT
jgi:hypothetical protein